MNFGLNGSSGNYNDLGVRGEVRRGAPVTVASAAEIDLGQINSEYVTITGTTTITSLGNDRNKVRNVFFTGALTLTYNAAKIVTNTAGNKTTVAGDWWLCISDSNGIWNVRLL